MIRAQNLSVAPPGAPPVVRDLSLCVESGQWLAINGPNGSGKSTLALALAGLVAPVQGWIEVNGQALQATPEGRRAAGIAAVLQEPASQLLQGTVADELAFTARNIGVAETDVRDRVRSWADRLGLTSEVDRDPRALSAGRQQLVLLGAALAMEPRLLVVDEGGAHWDPDARRLGIEAVRSEVARGLTVVWVTQEPAEIAAASRTLTLEGSSAPFESEATAAVASGRASAARPAESIRIEVSPWNGSTPRAIRTPSPLCFAPAPGHSVAIRGGNAVGKTVLLQAALGLEPHPQVTVHRSGDTGPPPIMAGQHPELEVFAETVAEEMTFASRARGVPKEEAMLQARAALSIVGCGPAFLARRVWELSAGERRLVQVLGATITPACLVLLDEPTCGLDRDRRDALADWIRRCAEVSPVLMATQDSFWVDRIGANSVFIGAYLP